MTSAAKRASLMPVAEILALTMLLASAAAGCSSDDDPTPIDSGSQTKLDGKVDGSASNPDSGGAADTGPAQPCTYTQPIAYVEAGDVDASNPCGAEDGTCVSGTMKIDTTLVQVNAGDIGEAYLFANPNTAPIIIFRQTTPGTAMPFKIAKIATAVTDACSAFQIGGRLDVGGDNQGKPGGQEDPVLPPHKRLSITLSAGEQVTGLEFTIPVKL